MSTLKSFLSILFISQTIHARSFNPCELENVLSTNYNLTVDESRNLTCVAQKYSQLTTNIINNGSKTIYYGIFQIGQKWCGIDKPGGKCNIKCEDLVDDDITDDIKCAQQLFQELGKKAWKLNKKNSGCKKEFNYLDENCHKNANIDDTFQVQPDFCELARKLMTLYDISKIDATIWSCISQYSKTGNLNQRAEEENGRDDEESCVKTRDVECAIKNNKQTGNSGNSFEKWPAYEQYCKNITESTCFEGTNSVNRSDIIEQIKNVQYTETSIKPKIFTTSTEVSVFVEDDDGNLTQYDGNDITSESPNVSQQTTEFLSNTLENPSYEDKPTIEGYSKVRIMSADKQIVELPETLESTSKTLDEITLINSSLAKSTTDSISAELSHTEHTTEKIEAQYYEIIDKCALAKDMNDSGRIPQNLISTFICIAEHESGLNVSFIDSDGQQSRYGLFQIDNQIYCNTNDNINQCNVLCAHLVDDHFDNDFECVRHIYKKEGLNYWPSYEKSCKNINSDSLDYCFEQFTTSQRPSTILNREAEYHSIEGTSEATLNDLTHMEMTTLINGIESAPNDGSLDFCEFSHQLKVNMSIGIWEDLVHYVCIADQISHLRPKLLNDDKFGIFSLKDNTCGKYEAGGICSVLCSNLLNDDLIDDAECMIKVFKELGLKAWNIDKDSCKAYTPKILRCIDEGKFSIPSDDESDDKEDQLITPESKDDEIPKNIENNLEMNLSRSNAGVKTVESIEDVNTLDQTTVSLIENTSYMEDTTTMSDAYPKSKSNIQDEEFIDKEEESTTDGLKFTEGFETSEKYFEEDSVEAIKNLPGIDTSDNLESPNFDPKNEENEQTTTSIKYDDDESSKNEEEASVEINLLTTTIESLLNSEIVEKVLERKNDDVPQTTADVDEVTEKVQTTLQKSDERDETEAIPITKQTTETDNDLEETTLGNENDLNVLENNQTHKDDNTENGREGLESSLEEDLEFTTESLLKTVDQKLVDLKNNLFEIAESQKYTGTEDQKNVEMESDTTKTEDNLTTDNLQNIENQTKHPEDSQDNDLEFTSESLDQISDQEFENLRNNLFTTLDSIDQNNDEIESDTLTSANNLTTENDSNIESETENLKSSQTTEIYDIFEDTTVPEISKSKNFSEDDEKLIHEEATSDIPLNNDDKTVTFDPEASKSFLENTEESSEEESTTNSLNIESISTEYSINQSGNLTQNTEKYIERETTTNNEMTKQHTEDQIYLESTTESSFSRKVFDVTDSIYEFMRKVNEDNSEQTTESEEFIKTELNETTIETAVFDKESNIIVNTEEPPIKATTESLYYTSIREIIEEYQKVNVKNLDNIQSKRNKNFSYDETTLDGLVDDYDDFVDELENPDEFIESLNQHTTLPITLSSIKIPQISKINKCELARYMNVSGFPENLIPTLICIAEHESELNPLAVKITKSHNKYGLFQIDDSIYCSTDEKINECEIRCELLTDNQFDNDFECVRQIYKKEGFNYWSSYEKSCNNVSANALDYCYEEISISHRLEFENSTPEMSKIEDIPVTTDSAKINLEALSIDNELKSIIRTFELCELTRELYSRNISMDDIPQYLCIADIKSHLKIRIPNENEQNYGLFFIDSEFCGQNESDGICSMKCSELWDTNISDDVDCVYKVIQTNGTDKWNLNSEVCQIYDNKVLECFDKTTELPKISQIDFDEIKRNASVSQHDVITESERMTDMISDMTDKNFEDLDHEITKLRSSNLDIESDEMTTDETTTPLEPTTSRIIQILTSTASTENIDSIKVDKQIRRVPVININLPRDLIKDQNLSKQVNTLIKNFTYYDVLPTNGSIIFNIFNFNIYGEDHDIKFSINPGTDLKDVSDD